MGDDHKEFKFSATLPPIQSAIKIGNDGMRVQLDIPLVDLQNAIGLAALHDTLLHVTISVKD